VDSPIFASALFGGPIAIDGRGERLHDLGIERAGDTWRVVAVRTRRRTAAFDAWSPAGLTATAGRPAAPATWLREALFDRQIVDLQGRRVTRIGDVALQPRDGALEVASIDVGASAVLRRLGLSGLARRIAPDLIPIARLHFPDPAAGALLLDAPRRELEEMDETTVAELLSRLPVDVAEHAVLTSRHRAAVERLARLRRRRPRNPRSPG
jgi:hypothetical protein